ncbi:MAG: radical SAM protein [Candidatus Omnitrophica bacterium]|nr:radical SAM protein [Candidatus Omnitrophota bacterium]
MPKKIYIEYMGCPKRGMDATRFKHYFILNGCQVVNSPKTSDYNLYISCSFRKIREDNAIKRIKQLDRYKGELIVAGCIKAINKERLDEVFKGKSLAASRHEDIDKFFPEFKVKFADVEDARCIYPVNKLELFKNYFFALRLDLNFFKRSIFYFSRRFFSRDHAHIRISWGCEDEHCTYCLIWRAVGRLKSKPLEICRKEFEDALKQGKKRIILLANNTGAYGTDINLSLPELLEALLEVKGDYAIEIEDLHPFWMIKYSSQINELLKSGKIKALHCPIQSASDRILELMNRRHTSEQLKNTLFMFKNTFPGLWLHTQVLLGFAYESEDDFKKTLSFIRDTGFHLVQVYGYSKNPYIKDPEIVKSQVSDEVIQRRVKEAIKFFKKNKILCAAA